MHSRMETHMPRGIQKCGEIKTILDKFSLKTDLQSP
jgi:hypothetical protein